MTTASPPPALDGTPLLLHPELRLSPAQFALLCEANPEAVLELSASGQLIQMTPGLGRERAAAECTQPGRRAARSGGTRKISRLPSFAAISRPRPASF